jgi:hypothetical protein
MLKMNCFFKFVYIFLFILSDFIVSKTLLTFVLSFILSFTCHLISVLALHRLHSHNIKVSEQMHN